MFYVQYILSTGGFYAAFCSAWRQYRHDPGIIRRQDDITYFCCRKCRDGYIQVTDLRIGSPFYGTPYSCLYIKKGKQAFRKDDWYFDFGEMAGRNITR